MFLHYGIEEGPAAGPVHSSVATVLGPGGNDLPIPLEDIVAAGTLAASLIDFCKQDQLPEIVRPGFIDKLLIRKVVAPELLCNAGLQGAFQGISRKIIRSAELPRAEEDLSLAESNLCKGLQLSSIHYHDCIEHVPTSVAKGTHCDNRRNRESGAIPSGGR
jgi:hypothetical protein